MDLDYNKNEDYNKLLCRDLNTHIQHIENHCGKEALKKLHLKEKLSARERIKHLLDKDTESIEIGVFAGRGMYEKYGGCPSAGVIVKVGLVSNRRCVLVANDSTVKAGSYFPISIKKTLRAQEISMENNLPIIYLVDSSGVFLPLQDDIFPDKEDFGRIFRNNARMSSMGITQISAIMGSCVAGGAYLPVMTDETIIVNKTGSIFLAGSYLVKAAIGEDIDNESLGGAHTHCNISGVTDYKADNDIEALEQIRRIINKIAPPISLATFNRTKPYDPKKNQEDIYGLLPQARSQPYDMHEIIYRLVDNSDFEEYKKDYGKTILTGYARIDGWAVGIVANQRKVIKNSKGEMQFGGVIYSDSSDKATRFISNCNQKKIPLVFLQDVTGFMVGSKSEQGGIIKDGAKLVNAVSNSVVPKFTIIIGNSYGAGNYAMCGKAYDPRFIVAWPSAKLAVMGGKQAAEVLLQIQVSKLNKKGDKITEKEKAKLLKEITTKYDEQSNCYYAASRLWVDAIINPLDTRSWISQGIEISNHNPITKPFNLGVIQV